MSFVLDDGSAVDYGGEHSYEELLVDDTNIDTTNPEDGNSLRSDAFAHLSPSALITSPNTIIDQVQLRNQSSASVPVHATVSAFVTQSPFSSTRAGLAPRADHLSPASITELERRYDEDGVFQRTSPQSNSDSLGISPAASLPTPGGATRAQLTLREACLLQHFIEKIAPWIDACDMSAQFEKEVPKRAMSTPGMLYAILSLSSRHQAIMKSQSQDEASFYHGKCLRLVIEALSSSEHLYDDNMLATVVLLRVYEEIDHSTDMHLHLGGMSRLLSAIPEFSHSGGLAEAASWQALRQDIQVSLSSGQSPSLQLEPYERSSVVSFRDDAACANMVILLFAKILRFVNGTNSQSSQQNLDTYGTLHHQLRRWEHRRQLLFEPTFSAPGGLGTEDPWPVVLLLNAPQVVAMQHYHACEIFLVLHNPRPVSVSGFQAAKQRREVEVCVSTIVKEYMLISTLKERHCVSPKQHHRNREVKSKSRKCQFHSSSPP